MTKVNHLTIPRLQQHLRMIYSDVNRQYGFDYLYGYLVKNYFRPRREESIDHIFVKSLSYLLSIANLYEIDIQEAFFKKYPKVCPYCFEKHCICVLTGKKSHMKMSSADEDKELINRYNSLKNSIPGKMAFTFEEIFDIIQEIYPSNTLDWNNHGYSFHMIKVGEELAELHEACCRMEKFQTRNGVVMSCVCDEIADVFAWMISEWGLWRRSVQSMSQTFWSYYAQGCTKCKHNQCRCPARSEHDTLLIADYTKNKVLDLLASIIENPDLASKIGNDVLVGLSKQVEEAGTQRQIDSVASETLNILRDRLRRMEVSYKVANRIFDEIGLIESAVYSEHPYQ